MPARKTLGDPYPPPIHETGHRLKLEVALYWCVLHGRPVLSLAATVQSRKHTEGETLLTNSILLTEDTARRIAREIPAMLRAGHKYLRQNRKTTRTFVARRVKR